ncbi:hypothetical protein IN07_14945 [Modestobacter caceresii]|uniref:Uncharacterized protein n=1 Tax=Modestobacter caceresii TaxID=1522368 RepID=A0A098Y5X8_9ACTN|nr:hypothetical protein [Modestobacter caceresii]KGH45842.1 hypothetical protein IN07_14945 [Modestobacter caceresii]
MAILGEKGLWTVQQLAEVALDGTCMALDRPDGNDEGTRTVTITEAGVSLGQSTPEDSRPPAGDLIQSMEEIGRATAIARKAADGTRWCRCCDTTAAAGKTSAYCPSHRAERNPYLKRLRRQAEREAAEAARAAAPATVVAPTGMVLVPREVLRQIGVRAAAMATHIARASRHYNALQQEGRDVIWLDNLMWSAKELDAAIASDILNGDLLPRHVARPQPTRQQPRTA